MKTKLVSLVFSFVLLGSVRAALFEDSFNNAVGNLSAPWSGSAGSSITVVAGSLIYPDHADLAPSGNRYHINSGTARTLYRNFTGSPITSGTVYFSMVIKCTELPTASQYITALCTNGATAVNGSSDPINLYAVNASGGFQFQISHTGSSKGTAAPVLTLNSTNLVVLKYTFGGTGKAELFVNPPAGGNEPGSADATSTTGGTDAPNLAVVGIKSQSNSSQGDWDVDTYRIGTIWADVVPPNGPVVGAKLAFTTQPANAAPSATMSPVVVQVQSAAGVNASSNNVPITLTLTSGSGTLSGTLTQNTDANGKATFNDLSIDTAGTGKQLTATASGIGAGLTNAVSTTFTIAVPVVGSQLAFTTQPSDTAVASTMTPAVVVQIQDNSNVAVNSNGVPVTLTLTAGTGLVSGTTTRNTDSTGKATFNDLTFSIAGAGKQLTAAASGIGAGLANAVSSTFTITSGGGATGNLLISGSQMLPAGLKVQGTNSGAGAFTQILGATRPDETPTNWVLVNFQNADGSGQTSFTNPVSPAMPHAFYRLRTGDTTTKLQPPSIGIPPHSLIVSTGAPASFSVTASGPMLQYLWFFNGNPIAGGTTSSINIGSAQTANIGNYYVAVANPAGNVNSAVATLSLGNVAPIITSQPLNQTNNAGGTAIFNVGATGTSPLSYQWYYNNSTLLPGKTSTQLLLSGITTNDAGNYRCMVTNAFGSTNSANAYLAVNPVPTDLPYTNLVGWAAYANVTGGTGGSETTVSTYATLRAACRAAGPLIIRVDGILVPNEDYCYIEGFDKTIVGVGTNSGLAYAGFRVAGTNIIIANLSFNSTNDNSDGVTIDNSSHGTGRNVWVDHCTFYDSTDGSVDVTKGADYVTVSWCKFHYAPVAPGVVNHEFVNLLGSSDSDNAANYHVTFHHNWYSDYCRERMPSVRFGRVHVFNNYYDCVGNNYCVRTRINAEVLVENNYFLGVQNPWERFVTSGTAGKLWASGNITNSCTFVNGWVSGAVVIPGNDPLGSELNPPLYSYTLGAASDVPYYVQTYAGSGKYPYAP